MKETEITGDWIDRYNEGELNEAEKAVFEERMKTSPVLRSEVLVDAALNRLLLDPEMLDLLSKIHTVRNGGSGRRNFRKYWLVAASLVILAMAGGVFYMLPQPEVIVKHAVHGSGSTPSAPVSGYLQPAEPVLPGAPIKCPDLLAGSFMPMPELELLTGYATRSHPLEIISPVMNAAVPRGASLIFRWRGGASGDTLTLVVLNNRGRRVMEVDPGQGTSYALKTKSLPDGLYYWKMMAGDDLVIMGRFIVLTLEISGL
jgi:hypothetical protein